MSNVHTGYMAQTTTVFVTILFGVFRRISLKFTKNRTSVVMNSTHSNINITVKPVFKSANKFH